MTPEDALARVQSMTQWDVDPALSPDEVARLVADARRVDPSGNVPANVSDAAAWSALHAYVAGDVVKIGARWWRVVNAGTSSATAPSWPNLGFYPTTRSQVRDGTVLWADNGAAWAGVYDLSSAAVRGWELKASKVTARFDFLTDNQNFKRSQQFDHCMAMADSYRRRAAGTVPLGVS